MINHYRHRSNSQLMSTNHSHDHRLQLQPLHGLSNEEFHFEGENECL